MADLNSTFHFNTIKFTRRNIKAFKTYNNFFSPELSLRKRNLMKFKEDAGLSFWKEVFRAMSKIVSVMFCWLVALLF